MKAKKLTIKVTEKLLREENTLSGGDNCGNGCASGSESSCSVTQIRKVK